LYLGAQWAAPNGELHANSDDAIGHGDGPSHAQIDDVVA